MDGPQGGENSDFQPGPSHAPPPPHLAPSSPHQDHPHFHMGRSQGDDDTDEDNMGETTVRPQVPSSQVLNVELHSFHLTAVCNKLLPLLLYCFLSVHTCTIKKPSGLRLKLRS